MTNILIALFFPSTRIEIIIYLSLSRKKVIIFCEIIDVHLSDAAARTLTH